MQKYLLLVIFTGIAIMSNAQTGANKVVNPFHEAYHDSLKSMNYNRTFPLLGKKAYKKGFDIPYPWGVGLAYFALHQRILIKSTNISFNGGAPIDLSGIIEFGDVQNVTNTYSVRPSLWVLPFMNVYGVFATGTSETTVPLVKPVTFTTVQHFKASSAGAGITLAGGFHDVIIIVDQNYNWVNVEALVEPVPAYNLDMRLAHNFVNPRHAERQLTLWIGTFFQQIKANTNGTIKVSDILPDGSGEKKEEMIEDFNQWYATLSPAQQIAIKPLINHIEDYFAGKNIGDATIGYNLKKQVAGPWNLIFGAQYQHNKRIQLRLEVGTFGERSQFLLNLNYAFLGMKKKA
ncbi:MAG: hypothetical protein QM762_25340 [Chryseolinea sp.]